MGSSISGIPAILLMDKLETVALSSGLLINLYKRYVEDIYLQMTTEETADQFHHTMNNLHPKLKFEIEKPEITPDGLSMSLLNFKVTISKYGKSSFQFSINQLKQPLYVHHHSAIPKKSKINFIRNQQKRIQDRCSTQILTAKHQNAFDDILCQNGHPENSKDQMKYHQSYHRDSQPTNTEWLYLKLPYISEQLNYRITNIFRKENIPVRIAHRSDVLRRALSHNSTKHTCIRDKCPTSNT